MKLQGRVSPSGTECPKVSAMEQQCRGVLLQNQRPVETDCWVGGKQCMSQLPSWILTVDSNRLEALRLSGYEMLLF